MPRSVYRQSPGNPIQHKRVPAAPLELEFAYLRGVDNDDQAYMWRVARELVVASFVGLLGSWLPFTVLDLTLLLLLLAAFVILVLWRVVESCLTVIRGISIVMILAVWACLPFPLPASIEICVVLTANALIAREIVRHFTFVATVAPMPLDKAWDIREAVSWQTLASSLLLAPITLCALIPQFTPMLLVLGGGGWLLLAGLYIKTPQAYLRGFLGALESWCSYNRDERPLAGILVSPSGSCRKRLTMLVAVVFLNVLVVYRVMGGFQLSEWAVGCWHLGDFVGLLGSLFSLATVVLLFAVLAVLPVLLVLLAVSVVGTPVFGRLSIPTPSFVPAHEWKEITDRIRRSANRIERESLYLGRVAYDQSPMLVPSEVFREHAHFLGDSGSGKTARGLAPFIEQVIGSGNASVMVLDLKGDSSELLEALYHAAATAKKLTGNDVPIRYFTLRDHDATYGFNPFKLACWDRLNDLQKTDILCGALGLNYGTDYGEGYFSSANASVLYATVTHFPEIRNFEQLRDKLTYVIAHPKAHGLDDKSRDAGNHVRMSVTRLASVSALNITNECSPNAEVARHCIDPSRLFERAEAHYFRLSSTLGPGSSPEIGRLATYMLLTAATLTKRQVPVYLVVDEFQRMASRNLDYLLQLARSMGVAVILANQSMQDLRRYDLTATLETNCRYRQWFAVSGWEDQDRLSQASGETIDTLDSVSVTTSTGGRGTKTSSNHASRQFIGPRLTKNDIKLVSDDDRKSIVLINRGAGYAQYGGMPVVIESDFHISADDYEQRKSEPWPSTDTGTFVPAHWKRPRPVAPHRGRKRDTAPPITQETITIGSDPESSTTPPRANTSKKRRRKKSKSTASRASRPATSTVESADPFERYLRDNPIESDAVADAKSETES